MKVQTILLLILPLCLRAEIEQPITTLLHLDRPYYLPGQYIMYSASLSTSTQDTFVAKVQLHNGSSVATGHNLRFVRGVGYGHFYLPYNQTAGTYYIQMTAYRARSGSPVDIMVMPVSIVDPHQSEVPGSIALPLASVNQKPFGLVKVVIPASIAARKTVKCAVSSADFTAGGFVSLSVVDERLYPETVRPCQYEWLYTGLLDDKIGLTGVRRQAEATTLKNILMVLVRPSRPAFSLAQVNDDQTFYAAVPAYYGPELLQFIDSKGTDIEVDLADHSLLTAPIDLYAYPGIEASIAAYHERQKVLQLFPAVEQLHQEQRVRRYPLTAKADYTVDVPDYAVRGTLVSLFKELISPLKFRLTTGGTYKATMIYEMASAKWFYKTKPVFLVNGVATRDEDYVANLPLQDVRFASIYSSIDNMRTFGLSDIGGVMVVETHDPFYKVPAQYRLPGVEYPGLQVPLTYPIVVETTAPYPQLKPLLYWQPYGRIEPRSSSYSFDLPASDDKTRYRVEAVYHRSEGAQIGHVTFSIQ